MPASWFAHRNGRSGAAHSGCRYREGSVDGGLSLDESIESRPNRGFRGNKGSEVYVSDTRKFQIGLNRVLAGKLGLPLAMNLALRDIGIQLQAEFRSRCLGNETGVAKAALVYVQVERPDAGIQGLQQDVALA